LNTPLTIRSTWRFLFSATGGYGHFHPLVPLARALKERGHEVAFATSRSLGPAVEEEGFTFFAVGGDLALDPEYQQFSAERRAMPVGLETELLVYTRLFSGIVPRLRTPDLVAIARRWKADMVVREAGEYGACIAAEHLGLPHAAISFAAALNGLAIFERDTASALDPIRQSWGLPPDPALEALYRYLYLAYSPPGFSLQDVAGEAEWAGFSGAKAIPSTTHFVRPEFFDMSGSERLPEWAAQLPGSGQPTIYVTLGTEANSEPGVYPLVLQTIIAGVRDLPVNLIVTIGRDKDPADFGAQLPNIHIERYIPQSLLLPMCDLTVMHGGSNTLLQALDVGLPMVVVPLIADQFFNAHVTQSVGAGQVVQTWHSHMPGQLDLGRPTPASVRAAVEDVLHNPGYRQNAQRLQAEMHSLPGQDYAVELVERVATEGKPLVNEALA
jgi:UDP:flavonoid glycosyltransferase YjiC (YdhE family)